MVDFKRIVKERNSYLSGLAGKGKPIIGCLHAYCPEEIVYAAGLLPVRILGKEKPFAKADEHMQPFYCSYSRGCLDEVFTESHQYLKGIIYAYACDHTRPVFEIFQVNFPQMYMRYLDMPGYVDYDFNVRFYKEELGNFRKSLEDSFKVTISDKELKQGIELCNSNRALLRELYGLLKDPQPKVSGADVSAAIFSSMVYPKDEHNKLLEQYISEVKKAPNQKRGTRLMIIGTEIRNPRTIEVIEEQGAVVVADELTTGSRYFWEDVKVDGDLMESITLRYMRGINDPLRHPPARRVAHINRMIEEFKADKVLFLFQQVCDPAQWMEPFICKILDEKKIGYGRVVVGEGSTENDFELVARATKKLIGG